MNEPVIYERINHGIGKAARTALSQMGHLIRWGPANRDTILDLGCGTANELMDSVLPFFKGKYAKCFGTDVSETMIQFAAEKYVNRRDLQFLTLDINKAGCFKEKYGTVNHVISTFAMHWIVDLETALKGIFSVLSPGGDFFTVHVCSSFFYDLYETVGQHKRWGQYFKDIEQFVQPSHKSTHPAADLSNQLIRAGFSEVQVKINALHWHFSSVDRVKDLLRSVTVQIENVPEGDIREEFVDYVLDFALKKKGFTELTDGKFMHNIQVFVAFGRKL